MTLNCNKRLHCITVSMGVPRGCVLSPILFSIYTNKIKCDISGMSLLKYADNIALVAYMRDEQSLVTYRRFVDSMVLWFQESSLELNISKTKEQCCGRLRPPNSEHPLSEPLKLGGGGQVVEQVEAFTIWALRLTGIYPLHSR